MDSPSFLISPSPSVADTSSTNNFNCDFKQPIISALASEPFNYDPFDNFSSYLDHHHHHISNQLQNNHHHHHHHHHHNQNNNNNSSHHSHNPPHQIHQPNHGQSANFQSHQSNNRLYDCFNGCGSAGTSSPCGSGSPLIYQYPLDPLDHHHLQLQQQQLILSSSPLEKDSPLQSQDDEDDDLHATLAGYVCGDLGGADSDTGYNSGVDLFSSSSIVDCSTDPTEAYCFRLSCLEPNNSCFSNISGYCSDNSTATSSMSSCTSSYSDIMNNNDYYNDSFNQFSYDYQTPGDRDMSHKISTININDSSTSTTTSTIANTREKRSVLMNLLIDGSDVGAGYTSINCRALQSQQKHQNHRFLQQR